MTTVGFLTTDFSPHTNPLQPGGCAWYRCYLPMQEVGRHGWTIGMGIPDYRVETGFGMRHDDSTSIMGWNVVVLKLLMRRETPHQVEQARKAGLQMSMTEKDHTAENAMAERVNGTLKQEYGLDANFENKREARKATGHGVELYNNRRPHNELQLRTPQEVHGTDGQD